MEIREQYRKETNEPILKALYLSANVHKHYSDEYVDWLEQKLEESRGWGDASV